jgi:aryl-alcohol dehydrogenase-like predicted oxidoreductase
METRKLGNLWPVSALTLGGGGLGQIWGETSREEAVATVHGAVDAGITLLDLAPMYGRGEAEEVVGSAFGGKLPVGVRVTTKCQAGTLSPDDMMGKLERSLVRSLAALKMERVDLFFLHSNIVPNDYVMQQNSDTQHKWAASWQAYTEAFIPAVEALIAKGIIGAWGITGTGLPSTIMKALREEAKPSAVQAITNLMDSPGGIRRYEEPPEPRNIIRTASNNGVGVMGIRAVQAGALTNKIDRLMDADDPEMLDYFKAEPFRALCASLKENPAVLAHRYSLAMEGVDTVVLGIKNRQELDELVAGEAEGPLDPEIVRQIDGLRLNYVVPRIPLESEGEI